MPVTGQDIVLRNILKFGGGFLRHVNDVMGDVRKVLNDKIRENISLTDYSLKDLSLMGHPYAKRHGPFGMQIHDPYYQVHMQSGDLADSQYSGIEEATFNKGTVRAFAYVGLDENKAPHALNVIYGTSKMIPRPVLIGSRDEVADRAIDIIKSNLKDFVVSFS